MSCLFPLSRHSPFLRDLIREDSIGALNLAGLRHVRPDDREGRFASELAAGLPSPNRLHGRRTYEAIFVDTFARYAPKEIEDFRPRVRLR